jgi:hypothetical protein
MAEDDESEVDLGISLEAVAAVIDHARAVQSSERDHDEDEPDGSDADLDAEALTAFIEELNEEEQAALIALAWIGRGDYDAEDWDEARTTATERNRGRGAAKYLLTMDLVGDLIAEGLAAFGIAEEEIER